MQGGNVEAGVWIELTGEVGVDGDYPKCQTLILDHPDRVDYGAGKESVYDTDNEDDRIIMNTCSKVKHF